MLTLQLDHVVKDYSGNFAVNGISYNFKSGIYGLLGKNGAGKSTLIKMLNTTITDYKGRITYNGNPIDNNDYRSNLGYMPQHSTLIPYMSINRYLYYYAALKGLKKDHAKYTIETLLTDLNLKDKQNDKISTLSGGMKRRVLLAQMLLNDPKIILLDEPTTGLDPIERSNFRNILHKISEDKIIIIATHIISDLEYICDDVVVMKSGKIALEGSQATILKNTYVSEKVITENNINEFEQLFTVVNKVRTDDGVLVRYLTNEKDEYSVNANLDDVFIKWG